MRDKPRSWVESDLQVAKQHHISVTICHSNCLPVCVLGCLLVRVWRTVCVSVYLHVYSVSGEHSIYIGIEWCTIIVLTVSPCTVTSCNLIFHLLSLPLPLSYHIIYYAMLCYSVWRFYRVWVQDTRRLPYGGESSQRERPQSGHAHRFIRFQFDICRQTNRTIPTLPLMTLSHFSSFINTYSISYDSLFMVHYMWMLG